MRRPLPTTWLRRAGHRARARREELRKDSPLAKACAKGGRGAVYEVSKRELPKWVAEQFARHGVKASAEACRALVELVGENPHELSDEIDKLSLWAGRRDHRARVELPRLARADVPPWTA
jgi:DNA polymerase III delta subunit